MSVPDSLAAPDPTEVTERPRVRIHLDTDLGSDTDDLCALVMLLGLSHVDLVGITTVTDPGGVRAGMTRYALELAGRADVPVVAGSEGSLSRLYVPLDFPDYWPEPITPQPSRPGEALDLLLRSVESGATVVAVGPYTNVAMLEAARPGVLREAGLVIMGGHVTPARAGYPPSRAEDDFNVQQDRYATKVILERCEPLVVPLAVTFEVALRGAQVDSLRAAGALGALVAEQGESHARDHAMAEVARRYSALPPDLLNFQYDPLACAVAAGWHGVTIESIGVASELDDGLLRMRQDAVGVPTRVVTAVDGARFEREWLAAVVRASRGDGRAMRESRTIDS